MRDAGSRPHSSYYNDKEIELAERLGNLLPDPLQKSMFLQSGADANEAAVNIARKHTGGFEIISPHTSFHGMSDTTRALTYAGWHRGYGPPQARITSNAGAILLPLPDQS